MKIRLCFLAILAALLFTSCESAPTETQEPDAAPDYSTGQVTIMSLATPDAELETYTIDCSEETLFCSEVLNHGGLAETPPNTACTMQYGGPETAELEGEIGGKAIPSLSFARTNGCEIARYEALRRLLETLTPPIELPGGPV